MPRKRSSVSARGGGTQGAPPAKSGRLARRQRLAGSEPEGSTQGAKAEVLALKEEVTPGTLYCFGTNDCGQLGMEPGNQVDEDGDAEEQRQQAYPIIVTGLEDRKIKAVACGGMHTVVLDETGTVWSFGCNDESALGRQTEDSEEGGTDGFSYPLIGPVQLAKRTIQISAGDCHSAALSEDGQVWAWGTFRNSEGKFGLIPGDLDGACHEAPQHITAELGVKIIKVASGSNHLALLGQDGRLYTCGVGEKGLLGRIPPMCTRSMGRIENGEAVLRKEFLLKPFPVGISRSPKLTNVWTGEYSTYVSARNNDIYVWGLNNYSELGIEAGDPPNVVSLPTRVTSLKGKVWRQLAAGGQHLVALDENGSVFTLGRSHDGRLGRDPPEGSSHTHIPTQVGGLLENKKCVQVAAGGSTSYAITEEGHLYSWGFGENFQLGSGDENDRNVPFRCRGGREMDGIQGKVELASGGGQHVAIIVSELI